MPRSHRLPAAPRKRTFGIREERRPLEGSLARVRRLSQQLDERERPFEPSRAPTWRGSSRDLVVNRRYHSNAEQLRLRGKGAPLDIEMPSFGWRQIGGDRDPGAHGGLIARADGDQIELVEIQPVREYVGDAEAAEVGFPFWTREATYDLEDLAKALAEGDRGALGSSGLSETELEELTPDQRAVAIAEAMMRYGTNVEEGTGGWSTDIVEYPVEWWGGQIATFAEYCGDEDDEFRRDVLKWHYVYGWGDPGYAYADGPHFADSFDDAIEDIVATFTSGDPSISEEEERDMKAALRKDGIYYFVDREAAGNIGYVEVSREEGPMPEDED